MGQMMDAVDRALTLLGSSLPYVLGGGNHLGPTRVKRNGTLSPLGFDCWGFADSFAFQRPRHHPGFNRGWWATVADDINCDSAIEDAEHRRQIYEVVTTPRRGDLLVMPSIRVAGKRVRIGHVWLVAGVPAEWDLTHPQYELIDVLQCSPSKPAIKRTMGPKTDGTRYKDKVNQAWRIRILRAH
jgi:hypothetical protein